MKLNDWLELEYKLELKVEYALGRSHSVVHGILSRTDYNDIILNLNIADNLQLSNFDSIGNETRSKLSDIDDLILCGIPINLTNKHIPLQYILDESIFQ